MIVTTHIDLSPQTYLFFVHLAEDAEHKTPEDMISLFLEFCVSEQLCLNHDGKLTPAS